MGKFSMKDAILTAIYVVLLVGYVGVILGMQTYLGMMWVICILFQIGVVILTILIFDTVQKWRRVFQKEEKEIRKTTERNKIKVTEANIVSEGSFEKPYFLIQYKEIGEINHRLGYGSYNINCVLEWLREEFELVKEEEVVKKEKENCGRF